MPDDKDKIPDTSTLLRRVHPNHVVPDKNTGKRRLSSGAFKDPEMSADVETMLLADGLDWNFSLKDHPEYWLVRLAAGLARQHGQIIEHRPEADNPYHAEILGPKGAKVRDAFRDNCEWVKAPPDIA